MKDAFGRFIREGDIVVYGTRRGSTQDLHVAKVLSVKSNTCRVNVMAGTEYRWTSGRFRRNPQTGAYETQHETGYTATLRCGHNVMVANGIDAGGIRDAVLAQRK